MRTLFVIEATGKKDTLASLLAMSNFPHVMHPVQILATKGHICQPQVGHAALDNKGYMTRLDHDPRRRTEIAAIRRAASTADTIILATDDDDEGEVIARDVARLALQPNQKFWRCRLRALDRQTLYEALLNAEVMTAASADKSALAGDVRRLIDFAIGFGLSSVNSSAFRVPVGRVLSCSLISIAECHPAIGWRTFIAPALDGGAPFTAKVPSTTKVTYHPIPPLPVQTTLEESDVFAWNYADAVTAVALSAKKSVREVNEALQCVYERGLVSYPRTCSRSLSQTGLDACKAIAERHGASFDRGRVNGLECGAHEAIRPTLNASLQRLVMHDLDATTAVLVARQAIRAGQNYLIEIPDHSLVPDEIRRTGARFSRVVLRGFLGWKDPKTPPVEWQDLPADVALLNYLAQRNLGRPGTWVKHIERLLQRGILTPSLSLNRLGALYVNAARECGMGSETSKNIEAAIAQLDNEMDAGIAAIEILRSALSPSAFLDAVHALKTPMADLVENSPILEPTADKHSPGLDSW